jgi:hypothetical protein
MTHQISVCGIVGIFWSWSLLFSDVFIPLVLLLSAAFALFWSAANLNPAKLFGDVHRFCVLFRLLSTPRLGKPVQNLYPNVRPIVTVVRLQRD